MENKINYSFINFNIVELSIKGKENVKIFLTLVNIYVVIITLKLLVIELIKFCNQDFDFTTRNSYSVARNEI